MESGINNKRLKVVWLCHLNNDFIADKLGVKRGFEFAPWMARFVEIFKEFNDFDVYLVAPYSKIYKFRYIIDGNIKYCLFPISLPLIPKRIQNTIHFQTNYYWNRYCINKIINDIKPDLIHLFGTENPYYSTGIFQFRKKYPVLITIQGIVNQVIGTDYYLEYRKLIEKRIITQFINFGVRDEIMTEFIKDLNYSAKFFYHEIAPYKPIAYNKNVLKKYDLVFFARVCKLKGVEDLIDALVLIKEKLQGVRLAIIGPAPKEYYDYLKGRVKEKEIEENVFFLGAQKSIHEVHNIVLESRVCVLPTHADTVPGTIIESMFLGIPCVSYAIGGIKDLNKEAKLIQLVEKGDIKGLSHSILELLENERLRNECINNSLKYVNGRWSEKQIYSQIKHAYKNLLSNSPILAAEL